MREKRINIKGEDGSVERRTAERVTEEASEGEERERRKKRTRKKGLLE